VKNLLIFVIIGLVLFSKYPLPLNSVIRESHLNITFSSSSGSSVTGCIRQNTILNKLMSIHKEQQDHQLTPPIIISPKDGEILSGMVYIEWTEANDSLGHDVRYTVYNCQYGCTWKEMESNIATNYYNWSTRNTRDGDYLIKVEAYSVGLTSESEYIRITIQNELTPEIKFLLALLLVSIIAFILIGAILYRKRVTSTGVTLEENLKDLKIGLCFGSFTDQGLISKYTSYNCPFSLQQIQSMLEYSVVLYQHGKTETMYGPIPTRKVKEIQELEPSQIEWNFIVYWMKVKDERVKDQRVSRIGGFVPAALLFFYPKQLDHFVTVKKAKIYNFFKSVIGNNTDITIFSNETLNQMERQLLKLFLK
jgi:hypothetical protein